MRILISSDNHIGYLEKDPLRGSDSFDSFEEVLQIALQENVDFVILGGDLFHANNPSRFTLYKTLEILKNGMRRSWTFNRDKRKLYLSATAVCRFSMYSIIVFVFRRVS